ncbi:MAG: winged helix-turn-helix domain-containing protein [Thermoplasmata archaeon]|jgi:predicted transcriptional regulator
MTAARPPRRRRDPLALYASVLEVAKRHLGRAGITRLSYGSGMPIDRLHPIVDRLVEVGLLGAEPGDRPTYTITARGYEFLRTYWTLQGFLEGIDWVAEHERAP